MTSRWKALLVTLVLSLACAGGAGAAEPMVRGTGDLGTGLARRWAKAGYAVILGSRTADKAATAAGDLASYATGPAPKGMANADAARAGDVVVLTVPFASQAGTLDDIKGAVAGKLVVDTTVPLVPSPTVTKSRSGA